jgi:hypothetical protein
MPLYMEAIMTILRSMEDSFDYSLFRERLEQEMFNPGQKAMLSLRLILLESCLQGGTPENSVVSHFRQGQLTIIEYAPVTEERDRTVLIMSISLSSPFMDGSSACGFFDMILGLFVEADVPRVSSARVGKLVGRYNLTWPYVAAHETLNVSIR